MTRPRETPFGVTYSLTPALVTKNDDKQGRVKVQFPWMTADQESDWIPVVAPGAGPDRGVFALPEEKDQVLVAFSSGHVDRGFVLGALWSSTDAPPAGGDHQQRVIKSTSGHAVILDDTKDKEKITIVDKTGKNQIVFDAKANTITLSCEGDVTITAKGALKLHSDKDVTIEGQNINVTAQQKVAAKGSDVAINGSSGVKVNDGALEVV